VRWILRVNPLRIDEDRAFLLDGLARAGLPVRAAAALEPAPQPAAAGPSG
jgi:hypothetical protein